MELKNFDKMEKAAQNAGFDGVKIGIGIMFILLVMAFTSWQVGDVPNKMIIIVAAMFGGYMALNIGANDVANNVGPAVGSKALSLTGAIIIASIFEASGALIAGGDVVKTIKKGIIDPALISDPSTFVYLMMAALLSAALWLNLATYVGAPVSTTHSIVGGVLGAGIAAAGWEVANWATMGKIAASWVISPVLGGVIAAIFLFIIKKNVTYKTDMLSAAKKVVPILIAIMAMAFATYLSLKGLKKIVKIDLVTALGIGFSVAVVIYFIMSSYVKKAVLTLANEKASIGKLFTVPLIFAAALLSFAHGANDVANAIGPLAAINDAIINGGISTKATIPLWVMIVGAVGISIGLALFGPKLIRTVGSEITELDQIRAYAVAMAAAITVIIASQLGLPVSSTHIAVGAVFGVGFLREYLNDRYVMSKKAYLLAHFKEEGEKVESFIERFKTKSSTEQREMLAQVKKKSVPLKNDLVLTKKERKVLRKIMKEEFVKRSHVKKIIAAWIITVPAAGVLSALLFFTIRGFMI